jgi:hypothetical protein
VFNPNMKMVLIAGCLIAGAISGCSGDDSCATELLSEKRSPNGNWKAVAFYRGCGALGQEKTSISIVEADKTVPNAWGNVLIYTDSTSASLGASNNSQFRQPLVEWGADGRLIVTYDRRAIVSHRVELFHSIPVEYRQFN